MEKARYQELSRQIIGSPGAGQSDLMAFAIVGAVLFFTAFAIWLSLAPSTGLWLVGQILMAVAILQWFVLLHDLGHDCFFRTGILNDLFGNIASMVVILPFYPWRYIHADHHVWVGYQDLDPTMGQINPRQVKPLQKAIVDACWRYWIPVFALSFSFGNFWNMSKLFRRWKKPSIRARFVWSAVMLIVWSGVFLWLCPMAVLRVYGLSYFLYLVASDPLLLSQHSHIPQDRAEGRKVAPIPYYEQDLYTRSVVFPKWISKWVLLYFDRHGVHHYFPSLPLYRLGDMQEPVRNQIGWWPWLRAAKKMPAHRLLLENSLQTGIVF